jgi:tripartite-type tricarboxylate transporter receptor subunit TctC
MRLLSIVTLLAAALLAQPVAAQTYPQRPLKLIVGGGPGSVPDTMARPVAERLGVALGQPVVVENRPGGAGSLAMDSLLRAPVDGHTLALATMSQAVFNSYLFSKLPYDPLRDLEPVALLVTGAMALAAHPSFPPRSLQELVVLAKQQPGKLFVAMPQAGSPPHVVALLLNRAAGIDLTMVPHKSGSEAMTLVYSGGAPLIIDAPTLISPHVKSGKLIALVVTGREREVALPGVPTVAESGYPGVEGEAWIGVVARAGTPAAIVQRLNQEIAAVLAARDVQEIMARLSFRTLSATPAEFGRVVREEHAKWGAIIREAGLKLD